MHATLNRLWALRRAIALYALLFAVGWFAGEQLRDVAIPEMRPMTEPLIHRIIMGALAAYIIASAIPFVPGAEIGFGMLLLFGGQASVLVYSGMVCALLLAYGAARIIPLRPLSQFAAWMGLKRTAGFLDELDNLPAEDRADRIGERMTGPVSQKLFSNRFLLLIVLLNTPGNSVLGGGGGLAFMAGLSGLYGFWPYFLCVLIAVAPLPLFFFLFGN